MKRAIMAAMLGISAAGLVPADGWTQVSRQPAEVKYLRVPHRFQIFMEGGIGLPSEPGVFNDYWNAAFNFGVGFGVSVLPWLEVNGYYHHTSFSLNAIDAKGEIGYTSIDEVQGGGVTTSVFSGSARFLAVPKARTNPYLEVGIGVFKTAAENVTVENVSPSGQPEKSLTNTMQDVSGIAVWPAVGIQYALSERWSAYSRFTYMINLNSDFAPGDLLLSPPPPTPEPSIGDNQVISSVVVGVMVRF